MLYRKFFWMSAALLMTDQAPSAEQAAARKSAEVVIEWGFQKGTELLDFDGRIEANQNGAVEKVAPLPGDKSHTTTERGVTV